MKEKKKFNFTDGVLIFLGTFLVLFVITMIVIFCVKGYVPDTLINMIGVIITAEGGILWRLTTNKRNQSLPPEYPVNNNQEGGVG